MILWEYSVKVSITVCGHIIVDYDVDVVDVYSSPENICRDQNPLLKLLKQPVASNSKGWCKDLPFFLLQVAMNSNGREVAVVEEFI
jgi:hypothetical protein